MVYVYIVCVFSQDVEISPFDLSETSGRARAFRFHPSVRRQTPPGRTKNAWRDETRGLLFAPDDAGNPRRRGDAHFHLGVFNRLRNVTLRFVGDSFWNSFAVERTKGTGDDDGDAR